MGYEGDIERYMLGTRYVNGWLADNYITEGSRGRSSSVISAAHPLLITWTKLRDALYSVPTPHRYQQSY